MTQTVPLSLKTIEVSESCETTGTKTVMPALELKQCAIIIHEKLLEHQEVDNKF